MQLDSYNALRDRSAVIPLDGQGLILVTDEDRVRLLHSMTTNAINTLTPGEGSIALFLSDKGRILAEGLVLCCDGNFLVDIDPPTRQTVMEHLDRYIIMDVVEIEDVSDAYCVLGVEGPEAAKLLESLGAPLPDKQFAHTSWGDALVAKYSYTGGPGYRLYAPAAMREELLERLKGAGAALCDLATADAVRLEYGRPRHGLDYSDQNLVHEAQLLDHVSFNKGCYIGQEIVERVRSRGNVHRLLVRMVADTADAPEPAAPVLVDEKEAGAIRSAAYSPALGKSIAFALLKAEFVKPDTAFEVNGAAASLPEPGRLGA